VLITLSSIVSSSIVLIICLFYVPLSVFLP